MNDTGQILNEWKRFYHKLYSSQNIQFDKKFIQALEMPKLSYETKQLVDRPINLDEIYEAIKTMKNNKCPGADGITIKLYKKFIDRITPLLLEVFRKATQESMLHISARHGVMSLLDKLGKDPLTLNNWCPLCLLNNDFKIYDKILATRMKLAMPEIIHSDQSGFLKGHHITDNLLDLTSIIYHTSEHNIPATIVALDFEKAFDKVEWNILLETMRS